VGRRHPVERLPRGPWPPIRVPQPRDDLPARPLVYRFHDVRAAVEAHGIADPYKIPLFLVHPTPSIFRNSPTTHGAIDRLSASHNETVE